MARWLHGCGGPTLIGILLLHCVVTVHKQQQQQQSNFISKLIVQEVSEFKVGLSLKKQDKMLSKKAVPILSNLCHACRTSPSVRSTSSGDYFRTSVDNPAKHDMSHLGRIYTLPSEVVKTLGPSGNLFPKPFQTRGNLVQEHSLLVRKHALELSGYLKQLDWKNKPLAKFVLWGPPGCGKSTTLSYAAHFCHSQNYVVLNFRNIFDWFFSEEEVKPSDFKDNRFDHLVESQAVLREFLIANEGKLEGLVTHKKYIWSQREFTSLGTSLKELANVGIERPKFASDCLNVLLQELKMNCQDGDKDLKLVILIDNVNVLFEKKSYISKVGYKRKYGPLPKGYVEDSIDMEDMSIVPNLKKLLVGDYPSAAAIVTVDRTAKLLYDNGYLKFRRQNLRVEMEPNQELDLPFDLLGQEGWELLDPFIPIEISNFDKGELDVIIDYYVERKFISEVSATNEGRKEIHFLTGRNPGDFMKYSNYW